MMGMLNKKKVFYMWGNGRRWEVRYCSGNFRVEIFNRVVVF